MGSILVQFVFAWSVVEIVDMRSYHYLVHVAVTSAIFMSSLMIKTDNCCIFYYSFTERAESMALKTPLQPPPLLLLSTKTPRTSLPLPVAAPTPLRCRVS